MTRSSRAARLALGALAALGLPAAALAATLNVNSTADELIAGNGQCTLREAVINANGDSDTTAGDCAAGSGADLINVPSGTYSLTDGLVIDTDLTLRGAGAQVTALVLVQIASSAVVSVFWSGNVLIERVRVTGPFGGLSNGGNLIVSDAIISENGAGGIHNGGDLLLRRSAVINNSGRGLTSPYYAFSRIEDSTISGNTGCFAPAILSAICKFGCNPSGIVEVANSTIADNVLGDCPSPPLGLGAVYAVSSFRGTLLDNPGLPNCGGSTESIGHNLDSDGSCGLTDPTDLSNVDPLLGPLQDNGGPTPTHALFSGSPAIDAIPEADCSSTEDQRGLPRPAPGDAGRCDIGAYEGTLVNAAPVAVCHDVVVTTEPGKCEAVASVDAGSSDPDGDALTIEQTPPGPYPAGTTQVTLHVSDPYRSDSCEAEVRVDDQEPPTVHCPEPTLRRKVHRGSYHFAAPAADNCAVATVEISSFDCFKLRRHGQRVDRKCRAELASGPELFFESLPRRKTHVTWTNHAVDAAGNATTASCDVEIR